MSAIESGRSSAAKRFAARALSVTAALAVSGLVVAAAIAPIGRAVAQPEAVGGYTPSQDLDLIVAGQTSGARDSFGAERKPAPVAPIQTASRSSAPRANVPTDPATAKGIGYRLVQERGWGDDQWGCLSALWDRESHWNVYAGNPSSGAYGIPQALPGSKMAAAGPDWESNPETQIRWGLSYIVGRYGNPCAAWSHSQSSGWY